MVAKGGEGIGHGFHGWGGSDLLLGGGYLGQGIFANGGGGGLGLFRRGWGLEIGGLRDGGIGGWSLDFGLGGPVGEVTDVLQRHLSGKFARLGATGQGSRLVAKGGEGIGHGFYGRGGSDLLLGGGNLGQGFFPNGGGSGLSLLRGGEDLEIGGLSNGGIGGESLHLGRIVTFFDLSGAFKLERERRLGGTVALEKRRLGKVLQLVRLLVGVLWSLDARESGFGHGHLSTTNFGFRPLG